MQPERLFNRFSHLRLRHYGLYRVLRPREPVVSPNEDTQALAIGNGTPRSTPRTPSPSPRRLAESQSDLLEVDEDLEEEIPGWGASVVGVSIWHGEKSVESC